MNTHLIPTALFLSLFIACGADPGAATEKTDDQLKENREELAEAKNDGSQEWMKERDEAVKELRDLREDLVNKKTMLEKRLADGIKDASKKADTQAAITELGNQIARVDASLIRLETSTTTDWQDVKRAARGTVDSTQSWVKRQAEKIDWDTKADNDNDGH